MKLHDAASKGDKKTIEELILNGADVNSRNELDYTPLHIASTFGNEDMVEFLISKGADVNAMGKKFEWMDDAGKCANVFACHYNALHLSILNSHENIARILIKNGADIKAEARCDLYNCLPIHLAAQVGMKYIIELSLASRIHVDISTCERQVEPDEEMYIKYRDATPLHIASMYGQEEIVEFLLSKRANVNRVSFGGRDEYYTPLTLAILNFHENVAKILVRYGANLEFKDEKGNLPLHLAAKNGMKYIVELSLSRGIRVDTRNEEGSTFGGLYGYTALAKISEKIEPVSFLSHYKISLLAPMSAKQQKEEIIKLLCLRGANVNFNPYYEYSAQHTPLGIAVLNHNSYNAEFLISKGAKIDPEHLTAAVTFGDFDIFKILIKAGAKVTNELFFDAVRMLMPITADKFNYVKIIEFLLSQKLDINVRDKNNNSIMRHVLVQIRPENKKYNPELWAQFYEITKLLISAGININEDIHKMIYQMNHDNNYLHEIIHQGSVEVFKLFLMGGIDIKDSIRLAANVNLDFKFSRGFLGHLTRLFFNKDKIDSTPNSVTLLEKFKYGNQEASLVRRVLNTKTSDGIDNLITPECAIKLITYWNSYFNNAYKDIIKICLLNGAEPPDLSSVLYPERIKYAEEEIALNYPARM